MVTPSSITTPLPMIHVSSVHDLPIFTFSKTKEFETRVWECIWQLDPMVEFLMNVLDARDVFGPIRQGP